MKEIIIHARITSDDALFGTKVNLKGFKEESISDTLLVIGILEAMKEQKIQELQRKGLKKYSE